MDDYSVQTTSFSLGNEPPAQQSDRRNADRHLTLFRVGILSVEGRRELCLIKNISSGGMSIRPYCALAAGMPVVIELKTGMSVPGTVAWLDHATAGIEFAEPVDVIDVLAASDHGPKPRMPRVEVECLATVRDGAMVHRMAVCDVSQGGVKLAGSLSSDAPNDLSITLPGMAPRAASLRWSAGGHVGLTFNRLLALPELVEWLRSIRAQSRAA